MLTAAAQEVEWLANPVPTTVKIMRDDPAPLYFGTLTGKRWEAGAPWEPLELVRRKTVRVELARGEFESAQIVVRAPSRPVRDLKVTLGELKNGQGETFPASEVAVMAAGYINTYSLWESGLRLGDWPDPLMPMEELTEVQTGHNQALWLRFHAPDDQPSGVYRGGVTLSAAGERDLILPVEVTVWNFNLPREQHFPIVIPIWGPTEGGQLNQMYPESVTPEVRRGQLDLLLDYRIAPFPLTPEENDYAASRGQRYIFIKAFPKDRAVSDAERAEIAEAARWWRSQDRTGLTPYVLLGDEPYVEQLPFVREQGAMVEELFPEALRCNTISLYGKVPGKESLFFEEEISGQYRQYYRMSFEELKGCVDLFIPAAGVGTAVGETPDMAREEGCGLWWYYVADWLLIPAPGGQTRITPWIHWKYGVPGMLHWGMTYWDGEDNPARPNTAGRDGKTWPDIPWDSVGSRCGDGYMLYPARGGKGYWPSIRLENLRDGAEDYEYFHLLKTLIAEADAAGAPVPEEARALLRINSELVASHHEYSTDPTALLNARSRIARMIEQLQTR